MADLIAVGRLQSVSSPLFLAVDAHVGAAWTGDNDAFDDVNSDAYRAGEAVLESDSIVIRANRDFQPIFASVGIGVSTGLVMRVGSSGVLEVYRQARRFFLIEGSYQHVRTVKRETASGMQINVPTMPAYTDYVASPPGPHTIAIGSILVDSGWLLLLPTVASGADAGEVASATKSPAVSYQNERMRDRDLIGLMIRVPPGSYKISIEPEVDLDFGVAARAIIDPV